MRSDDSRRPGRRAAAAPAPDAPRGGAGGSATSPSSSGIPRPRPVPLWHSLRLRIAAGVAAVAIGVSGVAGAVVDNAAAVDGRERLRDQALERLESAVIFYDARGLTRFGAVLDDPGLPAGMAERAVPEQRVTFYDGTTMYAAQRINPRDVLSVRLPGDELAQQRSALRWSFGQAAAIGAAIASLLGWLVGTWLSRRLRPARRRPRGSRRATPAPAPPSRAATRWPC